MRWLTLLGPVLGVCVLLGCSDNGAQTFKRGADAPAPAGEAQEQVTQVASKRVDKNGRAQAENKPIVAGQPSEPVKRKRISTGHVELSVEKYETAVNELKALVKNLKGEITNSDDAGVPGAQRSGSYTIRVPVDNYERFMEDVALLGELRRRTTDVQDITDQYYDTETRLKNDKVREQSLLKLYERTLAEKSTVAERTQLTHELFDLRRSIEEQEGRLKRWDNQTSYSTIVVRMEQRTEYAPSGTPDFGTTVSRTWDGSLNALAMFGKGVVLFAVAVTPWLAVLLALMSPLWYLLWRNLSKKRAAKPAAPEPPTVQPA